MADIIKFPTREKEPCCGDPYCETIEISKLEWDEILKASVDHFVKLRNMSLWDRIFNWPYGRE